VINRLVSDNEALKRDIQIERLRAEESRQTARLLEDKLERVISDYESRLLEANVTKTLLARKERQVETLQDAVELERQRAVDAAARERVWKDEMDAARADAKRQVEDATNYAALCEGRYNAISSHWKDQGEEVKRTVTKMKKEVDGLVVERKKDDGKIETLRELCDQQDGNIRELRRQKEEIEAQFERYKREQEEGLRDIKRKADGREREQERTLQEAREVLDKLRWALNVKEKIEWAQ
jgi:chromosome segregation ATPase